MEMLIVMTIMVIILGLGMSAYVTFTETTKYNEDVANIQSDILTMQRAAMLFKKDPAEAWVYGLGIDFEGLLNPSNDGTYRFFKWCSGFRKYGSEETSGIYPNYDKINEESFGISLAASYTKSLCEESIPDGQDYILSLTGYGMGSFNLGEDVVINPIDCEPGPGSTTCTPRFLLFEAVTGRTFIFDKEGVLIPPDESGVDNMKICFDKKFGESHELEIEHLTGKTKLSIVDDCEP